MDYFESLMEADTTERQTVRSAVVLGKLRYDEQLAPFVRTSKVRLESSLVQSELSRIIAEVAVETGADPEKVGVALRSVVGEVAVTKPKREKLPTDKAFGESTTSEDSSVPAGNDDKKPQVLDGIVHTDIEDHEAVLVDEILDADAQIDITKPLNSQSCVRCQKEAALEDSPVCQICSDALVALAKKKEAIAPNPTQPQQAPAAPQAQPQQPQQQQQLAPSHIMPLNPNAPYQCTVCGRAGTWDEVSNHLQTAQDAAHIQAIQNLKAQDANMGMQPAQPQMAPQQAPAFHASREAGAYEDQQDQDAAVDSEHAQDPSSHFDYVIENMANRAAARHFSAPTDQDISQIATTYGLDPGEIKQSIQGTAVFGNYHGVNGTIGPDESGGKPPEGYTEVDLNNNGNGIQSHEAVVPMNLAIRKVSEDLKMDPAGVYDSVKSAYGGDLSDEYHTSVQGEFHFYIPQELMAKATQHPQPPDPNQQQQPPQPGQGQAPGMTPQQGPQMNMPQPDMSGMQMGSSVLNDQQLEVKLTRDNKLADQREALDFKDHPYPGGVEQPSGQACPYCNGPMSTREVNNGVCDNCSAQAGLPGNSVTQETVSPSYT